MYKIDGSRFNFRYNICYIIHALRDYNDFHCEIIFHIFCSLDKKILDKNNALFVHLKAIMST